MSRFIAWTHRTNALTSFGNGGSARRWTIDPMAFLGGRETTAASGQHVHLDALGDQVLGQLADVTRQTALDDRRVLPGDQQDAHLPPADPTGQASSRRGWRGSLKRLVAVHGGDVGGGRGWATPGEAKR